MTRVSTLDFETHPIKPGMKAPKLVCGAWAERNPNGLREIRSGLLDRERALERLRDGLKDPDHVLVNHHFFYDLAVASAEKPELLLPIFDKIDEGKAKDTIVREKLLDIAKGTLKFQEEEDGKKAKSEYTLESLCARRLGKVIKKEGTWRLRYNELDGVPVEEYPEEARIYPITDAVSTLELFEDQEREADAPIPDETPKQKTGWALNLMETWGIRTDEESVRALRKKLEAERDAMYAKLMEARIVRANGTKNMKAIRARVEEACRRTGVPILFTDGGDIATEKGFLRKLNDPVLDLVADVGGVTKLLGTYVPILEAGIDSPICANYNVPLETGRTSCRRPNMQNPPRAGGVRECFIPRPGYIFASADYDTLELRTLAQVCLKLLGYSSLAEALRRGEDPHLNLAADLLGISRDEAKARYDAGDPVVEDARQFAKIGNFGFPGGLGPETFVEYAEGYGRKVTIQQARALHAAWFRAWPEMRAYFDLISSFVGPVEAPYIVQLFSGRVRGKVPYCAACNTYFQGLAADGATDALWRVSRECYVDRNSPLFGCRPVIFLHDQIIMEVPDEPEWAAAAGERLAKVMVDTMQEWIPDVPAKASPILMRRWFKKAKTVRNDNGMLIPWEAKKAA